MTYGDELQLSPDRAESDLRRQLGELGLNHAELRNDLKDCVFSEEQADELLRVLLEIMTTFVRIGWGIDSIQMFLPELFEKVSGDSDKLIDSIDSKDLDQVAVQDAGEVETK